MNEERYVAAIEISSSKIVMAVGKTRAGGRLDIIASEQEKCVEAVRYGIIQNLEETYLRINRLKEKLERRPAISPLKIEEVYVGMSARSLRSIRTEVSINLAEDTEITDDIIERLRMQALDSAIDSSLEVVDAVPRTYCVGRIETLSPKGNIGNSISGVFDLIVCRPEVKRNLVKVLQEKSGLKIAGIVVTALSTGQLILSSEEKRLGCMLVDMGAETTTVTIYKNGHMNYYATLPLGGRNITRDITSLNILEERAEEIKITSGNAIPRENVSSINYNGVRDSDVSNYIVARSEEIVANILEQIAYCKLKENDLPGGIICIGGGSKLNGILDLLASESGLPVKRGQIPDYVKLEDTGSSSLEMIEVASVLYTGAMSGDVDCLKEPRQEELPVTGTGNPEELPEETPRERAERREKKNRIFSKLKDRISGMFRSDFDDDSDPLD